MFSCHVVVVMYGADLMAGDMKNWPVVEDDEFGYETMR